MKLILFAASLIPALAAVPKIADNTGVRTLASVENRNILARGSAFEVTGEGLGPAEPQAAEIPYPQDLAGVSIQLTSEASGETTAYLVSLSATRLVAIVPSSAAAGDYKVTVKTGDGVSAGFAVKIVDANFGIITNTGGFGGAAAGRTLSGEEAVPITLVHAIHPGASIELDATGLGPSLDEAADNGFPPDANAYPDALLLIGDLEIPVTYLGRNPTRPGFDRLAVTLPEQGLPSGCAVPARLRLNEGTVSLTFTLPILAVDEEACVHPLGLSPESLATLAEGGTVIRGGFQLVNQVGQSIAGGRIFESNVDQFSGGFVRYTAEAIAQQTAQTLISAAYDDHGCVIFDAVDSAPGVYVDAGPALRLEDPAWGLDVTRGAGLSLNQYNVTLDYGQVIPGVTNPMLRFQPGRHVLSGTGGEVVGPFSVELDVSTKAVWSNMAAIAEIDTEHDLTLTFSGGAPGDWVAASGLVRGPAPEAVEKTVSRVWTCVAKGSDGQIVVPFTLLRKLPKVTSAQVADPRSGRYSSLSLGSSNARGMGTFRAPLTAGGSTELTGFEFTYSYSKAPVSVR